MTKIEQIDRLRQIDIVQGHIKTDIARIYNALPTEHQDLIASILDDVVMAVNATLQSYRLATEIAHITEEQMSVKEFTRGIYAECGISHRLNGLMLTDYECKQLLVALIRSSADKIKAYNTALQRLSAQKDVQTDLLLTRS